MSSNLRKCIALGPSGTITPGVEQDYRYPQDGNPQHPSNAAMLQATNTKWVRLWAHWPTLEPQQGVHDDAHVQALDQEIQAARRDGLSVILTAHQFPEWSNGATRLATVPADYTTSTGVKDARYAWPDKRDTSSPWASWIGFLYDRYRPGGSVPGADISILELCNEPNDQMWPQLDRNGNLLIHSVIAEMFLTARRISESRDHALFIMGPGLSDNEANAGNRLATSYITFMDQFFGQGFYAHSKFIWSHHNYLDLEGNTGSTNNATSKLVGHWTGYSESNVPMLFVSEGGARLGAVGNTTAQQGDVKVGFSNAQSNPNVGMATNYLFYDDGNNQGPGLRNSYTAGGDTRPAYDTWAAEPAGTTDLVRFRGTEDLGPWLQWRPALCSQHPGHLQAFAIGSTLHCFDRWTTGSGWSAWEDLSGLECHSGPAAISVKDQSMHVFAVGPPPANNVYGQWWTPYGWSGWYNLGGTCYSDPALGSWNQDHLEVFVKGTDGYVWHRWYWTSSGWSAWTQLPGTGGCASAPAAASWAYGRMDVIYVGPGGSVRHVWYDNNSWQGPDDLGGNATSSPSICSYRSGRLDAFVRGTDNRIWRKVWESRWSDWEPVPGTASDWSPACSSWRTGARIDLAWVSGNRLYHSWYE